MSAFVVATGMAFSFLRLPLTQSGFYHGWWITPGDIWVTYRTAHWIGWGAYGSLYSAAPGYHTFPGLAIVLAPLSMLTSALGLSECLPYMIPHPTAWLMLGPVEMLLGCSSLFALDALAKRLGVVGRRRSVLCVMEGVVLWPSLVIYGHPEDSIAIAFAMVAFTRALDRRWAQAAWLFAVAISFQPLVLLALPVVAGRADLRQASKLVGRAIALPAVLLVVPFVSDWHDTWTSVVQQPTLLSLAHVTPWTAIAPHLAPGLVSCGPTRMIALFGCGLIGWFVARRHLDVQWMVWLMGLCLSLRFVTESALEGYYIWPALALFLVVTGARSPALLVRTGIAAVGLTIATSMHFGTWWIWWGVAVSGLAYVALSSLPLERHSSSPWSDGEIEMVLETDDALAPAVS